MPRSTKSAMISSNFAISYVMCTSAYRISYASGVTKANLLARLYSFIMLGFLNLLYISLNSETNFIPMVSSILSGKLSSLFCYYVFEGTYPPWDIMDVVCSCLCNGMSKA